MDERNHAITTYPTVDFAKFLMAFAIVGIHTQVFSQFGILNMGFGVFSRVAVPFFFIASGFFFFSAPITKGRVLKFFKRILVLYLIYTALFLAIDTLLDIPFVWVRAIVLKGFWHLWFLHALLFGLPLAALLLHVCRQRPGFVYALALTCLLIFWIFTTYWPILSPIPGLEYLHFLFYGELWSHGLWNILCYALPCLALGHALAMHSARPSVRTAAIGLAVSFILLCTEAWVASSVLHTENRTIFLASLPTAFFGIQLCLQFKWPHNDTAAHFLRKSSTLIYCIHPMFILLLGELLDPGIGTFCVVSACAMLFALLVYWGSKCRLGKWLRYLQ